MAGIDSHNSARANVKCAHYFIVEIKFACLQCKHMNQVIALVLPEGYESLVDDHDSEDEPEAWEKFDVPCVLLHVEFLANGVANRIRAITPHYRSDTNSDSGRTSWGNYCEHCGVRMEEEDMHGESEHPLEAFPYQGLEAIRMYHVREPFEAWAGEISEDVPWVVAPSDTGHERSLEHLPGTAQPSREHDERDAEAREQARAADSSQATRPLSSKEVEEQAAKNWLAHRERLRKSGKLLSPEDTRQQAIKDWLAYRERQEDSERVRDTVKEIGRDRGRDDDHSL